MCVGGWHGCKEAHADTHSHAKFMQVGLGRQHLILLQIFFAHFGLHIAAKAVRGREHGVLEDGEISCDSKVHGAQPILLVLHHLRRWHTHGIRLLDGQQLASYRSYGNDSTKECGLWYVWLFPNKRGLGGKF